MLSKWVPSALTGFTQSKQQIKKVEDDEDSDDDEQSESDEDSDEDDRK